MFDVSKNSSTDQERTILRKLRIWIAALAVACLVAGIGIGAMLSGRATIAQSDMQIARAPEALSASFAEIARRVEPAVVNIETTQAQPEVSEKDEDKEDQSSNNPLLDMFRRQQRRPARGVGSGFIVSPKGYILTNYHVIEDATRIIVGLQSGEKYRGTIVGFDNETDVAVIKIDPPKDLPTVTLGDSNAAQVGDWVLAMGSPFGLDQTVTAGIISKKERESPYFSVFQRFLQTDAAINRGNSGGPLVNMRGEVIGMNSQIATSTGDYNGIGFALPANETNFVYKQLVSQGKVRRGYLGITLESVHDEFAKVYGMTEAKGAIVTQVAPTMDNGQATPASKAGLQPSDVIVEFEGTPVINALDLIQRVANTPVGQQITLVYLRDTNGKLDRKTATMALAERPPSTTREWEEPSKAAPKTNDPRGNALHLGITLAEVTPQLRADRHLMEVQGLYVKEIDPNGLIAEIRIPPTGAPALSEGDMINRINRIPVNSLADFQRVLSGLKAGDPIVLNITRFARDAKGDRPVPLIVQFTYQ
ncbi:MAG TPA: trypsin-like peptidase domain-containing protein [Pyrinomonadaceae bacterium]|jgi:serine protease Do|nr:trypsin-like peptidase domain-containing protein [Pyrinomonadaceae bacterium]